MNAITKVDGAATIAHIPKDHYVSPDFHQDEKRHLWPKSWQIACRAEEIPNPGDFITYEVLDDSIIVVRLPDQSIKAFHNVCPHRGRALVDVAAGHVSNFRCLYHGWVWRLDGANAFVQDRHDWCGALDQQNLDLHAVQVGQWGGFVFVNMDPKAESLEQFLAPVPDYLDAYEFENMRYRWYLRVTVPCNWKVALEAFMEGYHVAATHPQILPNQGDDYTQSYAHGRHAHFGYWKSQQPIGMPSPRLKQAPPTDAREGVVRFFHQMETTFGAIFTDRDYEAAKRIMDELPPEVDAMTAFGAAVEFGRKRAEEDGCGYPANLSWEALIKAGTGWHIFPNNQTLMWFDGAVWYRSRPNGDDPNSCIFDIWSLKRFGPGQEPPLERRIITDIQGQSFGQIVDQDILNMGRVQRGLRSSACRETTMNPVQEMEIINFHRNLVAVIDEGKAAAQG